jgi:hypothetical protein
MSPLNEPPGSPGWIVKLDSKTGRILGYIPVTDPRVLHCLDLASDGEPMTDEGNKVVWFKRRD